MRAAIIIIIFFAGCARHSPFESVCDEANYAIEECGATLPLLDDEPCTGLPRLVSMCVTEQVHGCDDLARLMRDPSRCLSDGGDDAVIEAESLPFPSPTLRDGGQP